MTRFLLACVCGAAFLAVSSPAVVACPGCDQVVKDKEGFCCGKGMAFGINLTSEKLYKTLAGVEMDSTKMKCGLCKKAAETDGKCAHCNVQFAKGKAYKSPVSYALAKGDPIAKEKVAKCKGCLIAHSTDKRCTACDVGFVAQRMFKGVDLYEAARVAFATLTEAAKVAQKCEACAIAMVTDGKCDKCKVSFKNGKKTT